MSGFLKTFLILALAVFLGACNPKVTDPADPNFDPDKFSFSDYRSNDETVNAFRKLFPIGTPKEFVDRVLVGAGKSTIQQSKDTPQVWSYNVPLTPGFPAGPVHIFIFSENNTVENIAVSAAMYVYPERVTLKDLRETQKGE